ncbi:hypothetical protein F5B20DRAFT_580797 [Whalleya microplaca]|nr:hypothetical protein F5B20DRAFT_580797 [Whalleya microplaca]
MISAPSNELAIQAARQPATDSSHTVHLCFEVIFDDEDTLIQYVAHPSDEDRQHTADAFHNAVKVALRYTMDTDIQPVPADAPNNSLMRIRPSIPCRNTEEPTNLQPNDSANGCNETNPGSWQYVQTYFICNKCHDEDLAPNNTRSAAQNTGATLTRIQRSRGRKRRTAKAGGIRKKRAPKAGKSKKRLRKEDGNSNQTGKSD